MDSDDFLRPARFTIRPLVWALIVAWCIAAWGLAALIVYALAS